MSFEAWKGFLPPRAIVMRPKKVSPRAVAPTAPEPVKIPSAQNPEAESPESLESLDAVRAELGDCRRCKLCEKRKTLVFGEGSPRARLVFVGEGPGEQEDLKGRPFVGASGQLLDRMIEAMGLKRSDVYICNVVKCRPPGNRNPEPEEISACGPYLERQLSAIGPEVVVALGKFAAQTLLQTEAPISRLRGRAHEWRGRKLIPTFHPSYLLRNPEAKRDAWADLQLAARELGLTIPSKRS